jgi:hypothetical protein
MIISKSGCLKSSSIDSILEELNFKISFFRNLILVLVFAIFTLANAGATPVAGLSWGSRWSGDGLGQVKYGDGWYVGLPPQWGWTSSVSRSQDGVNWSNVKVADGVGLDRIGFGDGVWLVFGSNRSVYRSTDHGATWVLAGELPEGAWAWTSPVKVGASWFYLSDRTIYRSNNNGTSWTSVATGGEHELYALAGGGGVLVAVGERGEVVTSNDSGVTWMRRSSGTERLLRSIAYGNGRFVVVGGNGTVLTSANGTEWQSQASGTVSDIYTVAFGNGVFVRGDNGSVSADGLAWTQPQHGYAYAYSLDAVTYGNAGWLIANYGTLYQTVEGAVPDVNGGSFQGTVGQEASYQIQSWWGNASSYYALNLPAGLSLNTSTGVISGTPTQAGTYQVILYAANDNGLGNYSTAIFTLANAGEIQTDSDSDGIPDNFETNTGTWVSSSNTGTNPNNPDTDGDGLLDGVETNTGVYASPQDTGTNPNIADTDGDGLSDGVETATWIYFGPTDTGTDPNVADTDGDGLSDGVETNTGVYVGLSNTGTNPFEADTSGDGLLDGDLLAAGYNPNTNYTALFNLVKMKGSPTQEAIGLFTESSIMDLNLGGVTLRRSGSSVNLRLQLQTKSSLSSEWTNHSVVPLILDMPGNKGFMRVRALGPQ